jgi:hypothetical protein
MSNELITGIFTIIAGIITAIVHIFITLQAKKSVEKISQETIQNQKTLFETNKHFEYLDKKKEFLEQKISELYQLKEIEQSIERADASDVYDFLSNVSKFTNFARIITVSRHYLDEIKVDTIIEYNNILVEYLKETLELIGDKIDSGIPIGEEKNSRIRNHFGQIDEKISNSLGIITIELKDTVHKIEKIINAT